MIVGDLLDTVLNLGTFAFIGFLAWLMMRDLPDRDAENGEN
ncbi:hypothetical protein [Labrenzia sp. CE80]|nr:hypothetical protein [Labrenzia sp. CE80]